MDRSRDLLSVRTILRIVAVVALCGLALLLVWTLRKPIFWVGMAGFIAIALSGPVNYLARRMPRFLAIAIVYVFLLLIPAGLVALVVPPIVTQGTELAENAPQYVEDVKDFIHDNRRLRELDEKYDLTSELENQAGKLPSKIGDAASVLGGIGLGLVNSLFALVNILIMSIFLVANGRSWIDKAIALRPEHERERLSRVVSHVGAAVAGYVQGALTIAVVAGVQTYVMLTILGVPFRAPLAVMAGLASLVPLVGATVAAVLIGIVTLFTGFPTVTLVWAGWSVLYQQLENNLLQPQIQKRTVQVQPFLVLVAVLFGATLLGVIGALIAIPAAASIQILIREWWDYRREIAAGLPHHENLPPDEPDPIDPLPA